MIFEEGGKAAEAGKTDIETDLHDRQLRRGE